MTTLIHPTYFDHFVEQYLDLYRYLLTMGGHEWPGNDRVELARLTRELWVPQEFGGELPARYSDEYLRRAAPIIAQTGLFAAQTPVDLGVPVVYGKAGRKFGGMRNGWAAFEATLAKNHVALGFAACGERERAEFVRGTTNILDGSLDDIVAQIEAAGLLNHPWVQAQLALPVPFRTEHELCILSALIYFGAEEVRFPLNMEPYSDLGYTNLLIHGVPFIITGARAVRRDGPSRPTAGSALQQALLRVPMPASPVVVLESGPPHTLRVTADQAMALWGVYPDAICHAAGREGTVLQDRPEYAAVLGYHELALHAGNTRAARQARGK